jgi:drug/metabolite transporter (DMT)-like permease
MSQRTKGLLLVGVGSLLISPSGLFIRLLTLTPWAILFWQGVFSAIGFLLLASVSQPGLLRDIRHVRGPSLGVAFLSMLSTLLFVASITHTVVAHTLIILAAGPVLTAVLSWVVLSESVPGRTWLACLLVVIGVAAIFSDSVGGVDLQGDIAAIAAAVTTAAMIVLLRHSREVNMLPALAIGAALTAIIAAPFVHVFSMSLRDAAIVLLLGLVCLPISLALIIRGPRYLAASQVGLILLLETVFGPYWVWIAIGERADARTIVAGVLILATVGVNFAMEQRGDHSRVETIGTPRSRGA